MKRFFNLYLLVAIAYSCLMFSCAGSKKTKVDPFVGDWEYVAETPNGDIDVTMSLQKTEDGYTGSLNTDMGSLDLYDLKIEDGKLDAKFDFQGYEILMQGAFEGEKFTGSSSVDGNEMPIDATKKAAIE